MITSSNGESSDAGMRPPAAGVQAASSDDEENRSNMPRDGLPPLPRLVVRDRPLFQSSNQVRVNHQADRRIFTLMFRYDWFHVILRYNTFYSLFVLLAIWTGMILIFAAIYRHIDGNNPQENCGLAEPPAIITFNGAFAFSLETCTTVGYGLPNGSNSFFEKCNGLVTAIYFQMVWSMVFNAFLTAFLFSRMARCDTRGAQVIFGKQAVVSVGDHGQVQLQIRCYDSDAKHPIVESHVRLYVILKDRPVPRLLRVIHPNDDFGSMLFLSFPSVVMHNIDRYSLLHPPSAQKDHTTGTLDPRGLDLRQADSATNNREEVICPVCAESYGTHERWQRHVSYQKMVETKDEYPKETSHLALTDDDLKAPLPVTIDEMRHYFEQEISEVIVVVEGIESLLSGTFSALNSYQYEDIVWHNTATYRDCTEVLNDHVQVDIDAFHGVEMNE